MNIKVLASGSSGNCYRVSDGTTSLLLEAGIPIAKIREGCDFQLSSISGSLISHSHGDHSKSAQAVMFAGVDLYCSQDTASELNLEGYRLHIIQPLCEFKIGTFVIKPFPIHHDVTNFGYRLRSTYTKESLMFITDTYYTDYTDEGLTHLMIEANYSESALAEAIEDGRTNEELRHRLRKSHMSIETTVKAIEANNKQHTLKQIYLLHLSANNSDPEDFKKRAQIASNGAEVYIA
jgi:phosphoribosyl 1,2-cyclic phosphodiesterase